MRRNSVKATALLLAALPLMGAPCTEEKVVDLVIGFPTTVTVVAQGGTNITFTSGDIDVGQDVDILGGLADASISIHDLDPNTLRVAQVFYRVSRPDAEPTRTVAGTVAIGRVDSSTGNVPVGQAALIAGWSGAFGTGVAPKAWVDITSYVQGPGLTLLNGYLFDLITSLQQGTTMPDPLIRYIYTGVSSPTDVTTDFEYEIKILFQTVVPQPYEVPFG